MNWNDLSTKQQVEEILICVAFVAFLLLIMFVPDLTTQL